MGETISGIVLDQHVPEWDVRERHSIRIAATPAEVLAAARAVTTREVPVLLVLMGLRSLPTTLARRSRPRRRLDAPLLDGFERMGFMPLGRVGMRSWCTESWAVSGSPAAGSAAWPADEFAGFAEPGYAKAGFNFRSSPTATAGCILSTETRVMATDAGARRRFRLYWTLVRPGSGLIRRDWLRAIRSRAERGRLAAEELVEARSGPRSGPSSARSASSRARGRSGPSACRAQA